MSVKYVETEKYKSKFSYNKFIFLILKVFLWGQ